MHCTLDVRRSIGGGLHRYQLGNVADLSPTISERVWSVETRNVTQLSHGFLVIRSVFNCVFQVAIKS